MDPSEQPAVDRAARRAAAMRIVRRYAAVSAAAGAAIHSPLLDVAALGGVHISLIRDLTHHYGGEFSEQAARGVVVAIGASVLPGTIGTIAGHKALGLLPFITPGAGLLVMAASSAAASYAVGSIFVRHFEAGGSLATFNLDGLHTALSPVP
jgi:uncharacterized protein (DUF697 family)